MTEAVFGLDSVLNNSWNSGKLENLAVVSLEATYEEREKSDILDGGVVGDGMWEMIVKYNGDLERLESEYVRIEVLLNGYAIVTIREDLIGAFVKLDEVEYVELPKMVYFQ